MIYIIGGAGFVGSAYARLCEAGGVPHTVIDRRNYDKFLGTSCDVLVNANGNSRKFMADKDPKWEFDASVRSVIHSLEDFNSGAYVHLSTGDVYPDQSAADLTTEDTPIDQRRQSRYGLHKRLAEEAVMALHPRALVVRMGGFVGPGMKKNAIFDMLNNQQVWLTPDSELQFIRTDTAAQLVWRLVERQVAGEIVNLGSRGVVRIGDIYAQIRSSSQFAPDARTVRFELSVDKLARLSQASLPSSADEVDAFLAQEPRLQATGVST